MLELMKTLIEEQKDYTHRSFVHRDLILPSIPNKIHTIIGMRRTGKSYYLLQTIHNLLKEGCSEEDILYINFEDERLSDLNQKSLGQLLDSFFKLFPAAHDRKIHFFLDEVQVIPGWEKTLQRFQEKQRHQIYISGSSAKLLSKEISSALRGRSIASEMWPYSFREYLNAKSISLPKNKVWGQKTVNQIFPIFEKFLLEGGMPETINLLPADQVKLLQSYVDLVTYRDLIERYNVSNPILLKHLIQVLLSSVGKNFSVNKTYNQIKSQGIKGSKDTLFEYLSYIEDAYLCFPISLYSNSYRKTQVNPKKNYTIDTGLARAFNFEYDNNIGRLFENHVFLELKRSGYDIFYYLTEQKYEIDFVVKNNAGKLFLVQVAWNTDDAETMERELRALETAEKELGSQGLILTPETFISQKFQIFA